MAPDEGTLTGAVLRAQYGTPEVLPEADAKMVMRLLGRDDTGLAAWAIAFRYPSMDAYYAFAPLDWRDYGHETIGPARGPDGAIYGLMIPCRRDGISEMELRARYHGQSEAEPDTAMVLRLLGRDDIDPGTVVAFSYATAEAFEAYADGNRRHHGHETLGPVAGLDGQLYGLIVFAKPEPSAGVITDDEGKPVTGAWSAECLDPVAESADTSAHGPRR